jgi:3-oxoacyl-[acyl-carrier protein] reductase
MSTAFINYAWRPGAPSEDLFMLSGLSFAGKTALIVGGSSGIGNAIAQSFRANGADVYVWGTRDPSEYIASEGSDLAGLKYSRVDVSAAEMVEAWQPSFSRLDVLVLSQGTALFGQQEFKTPGFREVLEVNLTSLMTCCTKFHSALKDAAGAVIIISSTAAYHATHGNPAYNASKAGAVGLTRTLGMAWAHDGIRVNGIAPGLVATKLTRVTTDHPDRLKRTLSRIPLKRPGTADEMAGVALFLGSPLASYIVGQTIIVDGGLILY